MTDCVSPFTATAATALCHLTFSLGKDDFFFGNQENGDTSMLTSLTIQDIVSDNGGTKEYTTVLNTNNLYVNNNAALTTLNIQLTQFTDAIVEIKDNRALTTITLDKLVKQDAGPGYEDQATLRIVNNDVLTAITFNRFQDSHSFMISGNDALLTFAMPVLKTNARMIELGGVGMQPEKDAIQTIDLRSLTTVYEFAAGPLENLTALNLNNLQVVQNRLEFNTIGVSNLNLPKLETVGDLQAGGESNGGLFIVDFPNLTALDINSLTGASLIRIKDAPVTSVHFNKLERIYGTTVRFENLDKLTDLTLPVLKKVGDTASGLPFTEGFQVHNCDALEAIDLNALETINALDVYDNDFLRGIYLPSLTDSEKISVKNNNLLELFEVGKQAGARTECNVDELLFESNNMIRKLELGTRLMNKISVLGNAKLTNVDFGLLSDIGTLKINHPGGEVMIRNNDVLRYLDFGAVVNVHVDMHFIDNPRLHEINFVSLETAPQKIEITPPDMNVCVRVHDKSELVWFGIELCPDTIIIPPSDDLVPVPINILNGGSIFAILFFVGFILTLGGLAVWWFKFRQPNNNYASASGAAYDQL